MKGAEGTIAATRDRLSPPLATGRLRGTGSVAATRVLVTAARRVAGAGVGEPFAATRVLPVTATLHGVIEGAGGTIAATQDPLVAVARHPPPPPDVFRCASPRYLAGRSYAVPDVSGGVSVAFEEVYPI
ncbi:MAG: hypothetical protein RJR34_12865 [Candidatus Methanoculleus thermohydrogenotrophicum]|nr:hypothetical protein [Candidatus Methanoculleus thermohydrogenotrophicum]